MIFWLKKSTTNSTLSVKPSENAVFSRHFACAVFQPYVFFLVFVLTSRNKGKFFSLRRLPYPAVLRKCTSLMQNAEADDAGTGRGEGNPQLTGGSPQAERTAFRSKGHFQRQGTQGSYRTDTADRKGNIRKAG